jgi:hypothetical protein
MDTPPPLSTSTQQRHTQDLLALLSAKQAQQAYTTAAATTTTNCKPNCIVVANWIRNTWECVNAVSINNTWNSHSLQLSLNCKLLAINGEPGHKNNSITIPGGGGSPV